MKGENFDGDRRSSSGAAEKNESLARKTPVLTLEFEGRPGAVILHCKGRIVFRSEFQALSSVIAEVLPSARRLVVDLECVDSIDSGGLGELVLTYMWAEAAGYDLKFASPRKSVRELFETTNLVSVFNVYATVPEAMAATVQVQAHSA
jgi:anti-anti-sigma factor